jgi:hypothetical protein
MQYTSVTLDCVLGIAHTLMLSLWLCLSVCVCVCLVVTYLTAVSWHNFIMLTSGSQFRL